jgi:hypothetical protein
MSETKLCKNCNSEITENYCSHCGQELKDMNLSIFSFIKEFLGNLFSLDSKVLVTFKYLLTKPGVLSTEYIKGRRKQYTLPLRLYLFTSIISIILFSLLVEDTTRYLKFKNEGLGIVIADDIYGKSANYIMWWGDLSERWEDTDDEPLQFDVLSYISKIFLFLVPIFALLMKCFYWKRLYINHLILVLHNHSFILISYTLIFIINKLFIYFGFDVITSWLEVLILLFISTYIFISAYKFYREGKIITLIKFFPLALAYLFILLICNISIARLFFIFPNVFN